MNPDVDDCTTKEPQNFWPFNPDDTNSPLRRCCEWHVLIEEHGTPTDHPAACTICNRQTQLTYHVIVKPRMTFMACWRDASRVSSGRSLHYRKIARTDGVPLPFCSKSCYAAYIVQSLRIPETALERFLRPFASFFASRTE